MSLEVTEVSIVSHPYFGVTGKNGVFEIRDVPPGRHVIQAWHELYAPLKQTVVVTAGKSATIDFSFPESDPSRAAGPGTGRSRRGQ